MGMYDQNYCGVYGIGMPKTKIRVDDVCKGCLWCWEKSLITKNSEDDNVYGCYCQQSKKYHSFGIEDDGICTQYSMKNPKDGTRSRYEK